MREKEQLIHAWLDAQACRRREARGRRRARKRLEAAHERSEAVRAEAQDCVGRRRSARRRSTTPITSSSPSSCSQLPHGVIGLLVAAFFAAALSSKAAELNALASTTIVDFYRHI